MTTTTQHGNDASHNTSSSNARTAIEESLIRDLAKGRVGNDLDLTTTQQSLGGITRQLVYISGLVLHYNSKRQQHQDKKFEHLQTLYYSEKRIETKNDRFHHLYNLTPTLVPTQEAQAVIDKDINRKSRELSVQADQIAQELMVTEQKEKKRREATKVAKTTSEKLVVSTDASSQDDDDVSSDSSGTSCNASLQDEEQNVLIPIRGETKLNSAVDYDKDSSSWIEVNKNKKKTDEGAVLPETTSKVQSLPEHTLPVASMESGSTDVIPAGEPLQDTDNTTTTTTTAAVTENVNKEIAATPPLTTNDCNSSLQDDSNDETNRIVMLEARIKDLESQLAQRDARLREFERATRAEQLGAEERIQALQLRLFISETRLKTFQDALAQHVEAVAANTSNATANATPERGVEEEREGKPSTPLFSRVGRLKEKNQLDSTE